jgi:homoserine acetyltransferase
MTNASANACRYEMADFELQSGLVLPCAQLVYKTYGELNAEKDNVVVLPTFYTGNHQCNEGFFGANRAINPAKHFIVSVNLFGNGISSSPSNTPAPFNVSNFPEITLFDNVRAQHKLLTEVLGVTEIALVAGWLSGFSMGGSISRYGQSHLTLLRLFKDIGAQYFFPRRRQCGASGRCCL